MTGDPDESLYGHWISNEKDGSDDWHIFIGKHTRKGNPDSIMEFATVGWNPKKFNLSGVNSTSYFTVSRIGKSRYVNLMSLRSERKTIKLTETKLTLDSEGSYKEWAASEERQCSILRYSCDGNEFRLWSVKDTEKTLKQMAEKKQIEATDGIVTIESLVKYLKANGGETLFNEEILVAKKSPK